ISVYFIPSALATSGACSGHGGVDCSSSPTLYGNVICNDGWTGSSVLYSSVAECSSDNGYLFLSCPSLPAYERKLLDILKPRQNLLNSCKDELRSLNLQYEASKARQFNLE